MMQSDKGFKNIFDKISFQVYQVADDISHKLFVCPFPLFHRLYIYIIR